MKDPIRIETPLAATCIRKLKSGDSVLISGVMYTARDMAHKRLCEALERGDTKEALAALEEHDTAFESGALGEEAELLRLEALLARGQTDAAASLARAFLQAHPKSPHADRARRAQQRAKNAGVATFPNPEEQR